MNQKLLALDLWRRVSALADGAKTMLAAVAYVTRAVEICFGEDDILVVDASDQAIGGGLTDVMILRDAWLRGARIFSCPGLHAKVFCFDRIAIVGSANVSGASVASKIEAAIVTQHPATVRAVRSFIVQLARVSVSVDERFLERAGKIEVIRAGSAGSKRRSDLRLSWSRQELLRGNKLMRTGSVSRRERVEDLLKSKDIKLDDPRILRVREQRFLFTGRFHFGIRKRCAVATRKAGGRVQLGREPTRETDVLVVGEKGSPHYLWETYGTKIERARDLREQTGAPMIVSEARWKSAIRRASARS